MAKQGIIFLVMDTASVIIANRFFEGGHPYPAPGIAEHLKDLDIRKSLRSGKIPEMCTIETADPRLGTHPQKTILILGNTINSGSGKTVGYIVMRIAVLLGENRMGKYPVEQYNNQKSFSHSAVIKISLIPNIQRAPRIRRRPICY
jgi:hypothetical protein